MALRVNKRRRRSARSGVLVVLDPILIEPCRVLTRRFASRHSAAWRPIFLARRSSDVSELTECPRRNRVRG